MCLHLSLDEHTKNGVCAKYVQCTCTIEHLLCSGCVEPERNRPTVPFVGDQRLEKNDNHNVEM